MKNFEIISETGCWIWMGALNNDGYGVLTRNRKFWSAHRYSYTIHNGPIPKDQHVLHRCDNPCCVNPHHLFLGTPKDNAKDKQRKGRDFEGNTYKGARKLTDSDVIDILTSPYRNKDMANKYKVSQSFISEIRSRKVWKHINV